MVFYIILNFKIQMEDDSWFQKTSIEDYAEVHESAPFPFYMEKMVA